MDNLTHSIAGIVTAELAVRFRHARGEAFDPRWPRTAWIVSAAAHNAPDLDVLYAYLGSGSLGYLLHHRGHTHTLAFAPLMTLVAYGAAHYWARRGGERWSRRDAGWLLALAILGPIGHLLLDLSNNYGIHPFWPVRDGWIAGDTIFIVEPLFWIATVPMILFAVERRGAKVAWGAVLALAVLAPWVAPFVIWQFALATTVLGLVVLGIGARIGAGGRAVLAFAASMLVLGTFAASGGAAQRRAERALAAAHPELRTLDVARAPVPASPACWELVVVQRDDADDRYALRLLRVSAWAPLVPVSACSRFERTATTLPLTGSGTMLGEGVWVEGEYEDALGPLRAMAERCDGEAYLRFARMPFVVDGDAPGTKVLGDLRFDRERGVGFAELPVPDAVVEPCPRLVPSWVPWRAHDLLVDRSGV